MHGMAQNSLLKTPCRVYYDEMGVDWTLDFRVVKQMHLEAGEE